MNINLLLKCATEWIVVCQNTDFTLNTYLICDDYCYIESKFEQIKKSVVWYNTILSPIEITKSN